MESQTLKSHLPGMTKSQTRQKSFTKPPLKDLHVSFYLFGLDLVGLILGFGLGHYAVSQSLSFHHFFSIDTCWFALVILMIFYVFDLYKPESQIEGMRTPVRSLVAAGFAFLVIVFVMNLGIITPHAKNFNIALFMFVAMPFVGTWSSLSRFIVVKWARSRAKKMRWLVIADWECSQQFWEEYSHHYKTDEADIVFLVDKIAEDNGSLVSCKVGSWDEIEDRLKETWTGIVLAKGSRLFSGSLPEKLMHARLTGTRIYDLNDYFESFWFKVPVFNLKSGWFAMSHGFDLLHNMIGWRLKRISDIFLAIGLFVFFSIPMLLISLIILLESRGGAIYRQKRVGLNERIFTLYKFRTMYANRESEGIYTASNDDRITKVGKVLRKTRLDELPQIFNVLKGDMSLIGPRAEWVECVKNYENNIPFYHLRHLVKPGITGWAQVFYPYGESVEDAKEKLQYDLYYIKNYSFFLDIAIIFKTVRVILFGKGQ